MSRLLIIGGRVLDPATGTDQPADIVIVDKHIVEIATQVTRTDSDRVVDAGGCLVTPGLIDPHVHLREPGQEHKETIATGTRAAVAGGFTTVCCMPNTDPPLDDAARIRWVRERAEATGLCRVYPVGCVSVGRDGESLADLAAMADAGAVAFSDDGDVVADADLMALALEQSARAGRVLMQHCQAPAMTRGSVMHEGRVSIRLGLTGWPREAEEQIIARDIEQCREIGLKADIGEGGGLEQGGEGGGGWGGGGGYHVQHISSGGSVELVRRARAEGLAVTAEATPHHLLLTDESCVGYDTSAKMNPPLREAADIEAIRTGVADGTITILATDHAPHAPQEKARPFEDAPFGIIGLETALALYVEALVDLIGWPRLIELMTAGPARLCGLDSHGLGRLAVGGPADVTVIDPEMEWTISVSALAGRSRNTPFLGRRVRGRAVATVVAGQVRHAIPTART